MTNLIYYNKLLTIKGLYQIYMISWNFQFSIKRSFRYEVISTISMYIDKERINFVGSVWKNIFKLLNYHFLKSCKYMNESIYLADYSA